jgi:hypothetical protein
MSNPIGSCVYPTPGSFYTCCGCGYGIIAGDPFLPITRVEPTRTGHLCERCIHSFPFCIVCKTEIPRTTEMISRYLPRRPNESVRRAENACSGCFTELGAAVFDPQQRALHRRKQSA